VSKSSFLKQFFKQNKMVGSLTPSSRFLAAKMLNHIPIKESKVIVELGPGTGVFTEKILEKLGQNTQLIVVELNDDFFNTLKNKLHHPNLHLRHGSADQIGKYLKELGFEKKFCNKPSRGDHGDVEKGWEYCNAENPDADILISYKAPYDSVMIVDMKNLKKEVIDNVTPTEIEATLKRMFPVNTGLN